LAFDRGASVVEADARSAERLRKLGDQVVVDSGVTTQDEDLRWTEDDEFRR
jgi:hypothetical protein